MVIIKEQDLRQAIREGLAEARVNHDDAGFFETLIMLYVRDHKVQPIELTEEGKAALCQLKSSV